MDTFTEERNRLMKAGHVQKQLQNIGQTFRTTVFYSFLKSVMQLQSCYIINFKCYTSTAELRERSKGTPVRSSSALGRDTRTRYPDTPRSMD